jgi:hypothetical protein
VGDRPRQALGTRLERGAHPELPQPELRRHQHRRVKVSTRDRGLCQNGSCDDKVGNRGNQDEDYDEERADNKIGTKVARVDNRIDARSKNDAKTSGKSKKKIVRKFCSML